MLLEDAADRLAEALAAVVQVEDAQLLRLVLCQEQVLVFCGAVIVEEQIGWGSL